MSQVTLDTAHRALGGKLVISVSCLGLGCCGPMCNADCAPTNREIAHLYSVCLCQKRSSFIYPTVKTFRDSNHSKSELLQKLYHGPCGLCQCAGSQDILVKTDTHIILLLPSISSWLPNIYQQRC